MKKLIHIFLLIISISTPVEASFETRMNLNKQVSKAEVIALATVTDVYYLNKANTKLQILDIVVDKGLVNSQKGDTFKVIGNNGLSASSLEIETSGKQAFFLLAKNKYYEESLYKSVNLRFSVYQIQDGYIYTFKDYKKISIEDAEKLFIKTINSPLRKIFNWLFW